MPEDAQDTSAAPAPPDHELRLARRLPDAVGVGAYLKASACVLRGDRVRLSAPVGDLDTPDAVRRLRATVDDLLARTGARPRAVGHDLHPDFPSTRLAAGLGPQPVAVQHHHAHIAAVAAEHGHEGPLLGLALDGFGLGPGGQSWGGELLAVDGASYRRLGHLARLAQPGGDAAARAPWRMAAAALHALGRGDEIATRFAGVPGAELMAGILGRGVNCPATSGCGRLFDAAAALAGLHPVAEFEGQAPMALESLVTAPAVVDGAWRVNGEGGLDLLPLLAVVADAPSASAAADAFHGTLVAALAEWVADGAEATGLRTVAFGGGCFLNRVLREGLRAELAARGLAPLLPEALPPGDQAVALGQAVVAALDEEGRGRDG